MMKFVFMAALVVSALASGKIAMAQSDNGGTVIHPPSLSVDGGINAKGTVNQQSPASNVNGAPVTLPSPSGAAKRSSGVPDVTSNALTKSPKGPGSGGNDATK